METKKLYRSTSDKMLGGVAAGLGHYFVMDPVVMRLIFLGIAVITAFFPAVIGYIVAMLIIPKEGVIGSAQQSDHAEQIKSVAKEIGEGMKGHSSWLGERRNMFGLILVVIGLIVLANNLLPGFGFASHFIWPALIILAGLFVIARSWGAKATKYQSQ